MTLLERFNAKWVENPETGCWDWTASKTSVGYGRFRVDSKTQGAHRVSYELHVGEIPDGLLVCHRCDNRKCVRPDHLFLGTNADNMRDRDQKGRQWTPRGESHGSSKLTQDDVAFIHWALPRWGYGGGAHLANFFGVHKTAINKIKKGRTWKDVSLTTEDSK